MDQHLTNRTMALDGESRVFPIYTRERERERCNAHTQTNESAAPTRGRALFRGHAASHHHHAGDTTNPKTYPRSNTESALGYVTLSFFNTLQLTVIRHASCFPQPNHSPSMTGVCVPSFSTSNSTFACRVPVRCNRRRRAASARHGRKNEKSCYS